MNLANVFRGDLFSFTSLTNAINLVPPQPTSINEFVKFRESGINTLSVIVEEKEGRIGIAASAPRGSVGRGVASKRRKARSFTVPHYPTYDAILASSIQDVRQFGSTDAMETVEGKLSEKREDMLGILNQTRNFGQWGAVQGVLYDDDGSVIYDWFDEFGVERNEIQLDLSDSSLELRDEVIKIKRMAEKELGGYTFSQFTLALPGPVFDKFVAHRSLKEAYDRQADGAFKRDDLRKGFLIADNVWVKSVDIVDVGNGLKLIPEDEGFLLPNADALYKLSNSPADTIQAANTVGLPFYMASEPMPFGKGADLQAETNFLAFVEKPRAIVRIVFI